jgi:hypothetical protein
VYTQIPLDLHVNHPLKFTTDNLFISTLPFSLVQGLTAKGQEFQLNGKDIKILSGSLHYFRKRVNK